MLGKPTVKGTRITVELILKKLAEGMSVDDFIKGYPHISREAVMAALAYASDVISDEQMLPLAS